MKKIFFVLLLAFSFNSFAQVQQQVNSLIITDSTNLQLSITALRSLVNPSTGIKYYVTDKGQEGFWYYDASDNTSSDNIGTILVSSNGKRFKRIYSNEINVNWFGAKSDGIANDRSAVQLAINSASEGATLFFPSNCRIHGTLTINKILNIKGQSVINANYTGSYPASALYFDSSVTTCLYTTKGLSLESVAIVGSNQVYGIFCDSASLVLNNAVIESFQTCVNLVYGHYSKLSNSYIGYCDYSLSANYCYNLKMDNMTIQANTTAITLNNGTYLNMQGGSIENFTGAGINVASQSNVNCFGTYFEGIAPGGSAQCINLAANTSATAIGCHTYLTQCAYFIYAPNNNCRIFSRNNFFVYPSDASNVQVYSINPSSTGNNIDIAGDNWQNNAGVNVSYCNTSLFADNSYYNIIFPYGHPRFRKDINTKIDVQKLSLTTPISPESGTIVNFANAGFGTDDPVGLHNTSYGYVPYKAIYENGTWQKLGGVNDIYGRLKINGVSEYADNASATDAGLPIGSVYRTGDVLKIVH